MIGFERATSGGRRATVSTRRSGVYCSLLVVFSIISLLQVIPSISFAASCTSANCLQIEQIRQNQKTDKYIFKDPNWNVRVGQLLQTLDSYTAYFDSVRQYYPTQASFDSTVEGLRLNYLNAMNALIGQATIREDPPAQGGSQSSAGNSGQNNSSGSGSSGGIGVGEKRIVLSLPNGKKFAWEFVPHNGKKESAKLISKGRVQ